MNLQIIRKEILEIISNKQKELNLSFVEDTHTYFMNDLNGNLQSNFPSVSSVLKNFYTPFPEQEISLRKSKGCVVAQKELLLEWKTTGDYATNMGSRVHFLLEKYLVELYGSYKDVRQPIFTCDNNQIFIGDNMVKAGQKFIELMHSRGAVLLDTEMVLGCPYLGYTGQPDKVWLFDKNGQLGLIISDYKTNQPKNFESQWYTNPMLSPFQEYDDTALSHYYLQLPFYIRLLLQMLKGTKYENISFFGGIVLLLKEDATYQEYRIPKDIINKVFSLDIKTILNNKK